MTGTGAGRRGTASLGLAAVLALAGLLFTTSATTARGTSLRTDRLDAVTLNEQEQARLKAREDQLKALRAEVEARTSRVAAVDEQVRALQQQAAPLAAPAGLQAVTGPAFEVTLTDAPSGQNLPSYVRPDDLVVHQQDVQAVVNALWAGGAEAMTLMGQRVISTSAVRCVGNTLILQGRVYSPPYTIVAIGDPARLQRSLDEDPTVSIYREYATRLNLGWKAGPLGTRTLPAFDGTTQLRYARLAGTPGPSASSTGLTP